MHCKHGMLKHPRGKICRKAPRKAKHRASKKDCKWGKLKTPKGRRICKKKPKHLFKMKLF